MNELQYGYKLIDVFASHIVALSSRMCVT